MAEGRPGGVMAPLVTPFDAAGRVSPACVRALVRRVRPYARAVVPTISCGEGVRLDRESWRTVNLAALDAAEGLPVITGIQCAEPAEVVARGRWAARHGAAGVFVGPPWSQGRRQREVYRAYARVAAALDLPVYLYNESVVSGVELALGTLVAVCSLPTVVGVKESGRAPGVTRSLLRAVDGVDVYQGWEDLLTATPGVAGLIGPLVLLDPALCARFAARPGPELQDVVTAACRRHGLFGADYVARTKAALVSQGVLRTAAPAPGPTRAA
ncbi:dihydrodipicolinate synthase family protein [Streptomyces sp. NPDC050560]|uniref:dihydrodipicolinate synthase family protein n=1 Tax=Streptomyces sp. NPDC050560 TaxID=3365630 RepID=UPI00378F92DF